jgi:hypothetical protein
MKTLENLILAKGLGPDYLILSASRGSHSLEGGTMKLILSLLLVSSLGATSWSASAAKSVTPDSKSDAIKMIADIHSRIQKEGLAAVLKKAKWPTADQLDSVHLNATTTLSDNPFDDCLLNPTMNGCTGNDTWPGYDPFSQNNLQLRDDGIQIVSVEVLYQTLTYFKVKHYFGKVKKPNNDNSGVFGDPNQPSYTWTFKVIDPVDGAYFSDLDTEMVLGALREFRKYVIALLCNDPNPDRMLAMMNKYDVGTRFRWDMAWALLGNQLPESPNKYMVFGAKWRKFSAALDGIEGTSLMRLKNPSGGDVPWNPGPSVAGAVQSTGGSMATLGFVSREIVGLIRLAGDIIANFLDFFCISDLSVNAKKETNKQQAIYKLLDIKKRAYDRYGPLKPVLDKMGQDASAAAGHPVSFYP